MPLRVSGKNISVGEALRERINTRVAEAMAKYFDGGFSGHVTIGREGFGFRTECVVHLDSGIVLEADALAADAYVSADQAAMRIEKRLRGTSAGARTAGRHGPHGKALDRDALNRPGIDTSSAIGAAPAPGSVRQCLPKRTPLTGHQRLLMVRRLCDAEPCRAPHLRKAPCSSPILSRPMPSFRH
jgi:ribosomal subunit interface protein